MSSAEPASPDDFSFSECIWTSVRYPACASTERAPVVYARRSNSRSPALAMMQPAVMQAMDTVTDTCQNSFQLNKLINQ